MSANVLESIFVEIGIENFLIDESNDNIDELELLYFLLLVEIGLDDALEVLLLLVVVPLLLLLLLLLFVECEELLMLLPLLVMVVTVVSLASDAIFASICWVCCDEQMIE